MTFDEFIEEWRGCGTFIEARTSGSTGDPKPIRLPKEFVRQSARRSVRFFGLTSGSRLHSCVSPDFIGGKMMAVRAEEAGCSLTWETPSNRPLETVGEDGIDLLAVVPSQMVHILERPEMWKLIGTVIIGGSPIDSLLCERIEASGLNAYETYGMTETASHIALRRVGEEWFSTLDGIGVSLDGRGCLVIRFDTGEEFVTNDLAEIKDADGSVGPKCGEFRILGRIDHVIITGGRKVNPLDVERRISHLIDRPFMVTSEPDCKWGRIVVLRIEGESADIDETEGDGWKCRLHSALRDILQPYEAPKEIEVVATLPRTPNGKIKR